MMSEKKVPAIRFRGFEDDWEQRKLSDLVDVCSGMDYKHLSIGNIPVFGTGGYMLSVDKALSYDRDAIGIGRKGTIDKPYILKAPFWTVDTLFYCIPRDEGTLNFDYDLFQCIDWKQKDESTGVPSLSKVAINDTDVIVPKTEEQKKIGYFFEELDLVITLHQCKLEKLKIVKKSMLVNCFPKNGEKVPKFRFSGFTGDWEQRKVGEVIEDYVEKTTVQNQYPVLTSSQQQGIVLQEDYFADRQVTTNDNVGYYVLPRGYFTYRSRSDTDLFVFNRNNLIDKGIISYYYPVFRPKNADSNFLLRRLNKGIRSQVSMAAEGTGQHVLAHSKLKSMEFLVPSVPEQKLIGAYFEILDHLITLHQSELEKLQKIKKSLLERMFV